MPPQATLEFFMEYLFFSLILRVNAKVSFKIVGVHECKTITKISEKCFSKTFSKIGMICGFVFKAHSLESLNAL